MEAQVPRNRSRAMAKKQGMGEPGGPWGLHGEETSSFQAHLCRPHSPPTGFLKRNLFEFLLESENSPSRETLVLKKFSEARDSRIQIHPSQGLRGGPTFTRALKCQPSPTGRHPVGVGERGCGEVCLELLSE